MLDKLWHNNEGLVISDQREKCRKKNAANCLLRIEEVLYYEKSQHVDIDFNVIPYLYMCNKNIGHNYLGLFITPSICYNFLTFSSIYG